MHVTKGVLVSAEFSMKAGFSSTIAPYAEVSHLFPICISWAPLVVQ